MRKLNLAEGLCPDRAPQGDFSNLYLRSCAARSNTFTPWQPLQTRLWHEDTNPKLTDHAISMLKAAWPDLNAEVTSRAHLHPPGFSRLG